eukprot:9191577-Lingulodinium_polyedra.AAC.1
MAKRTRRAILRGFRTFATADGEINPGDAVGDEETPANAEAETEPVMRAPLSQAQKDLIQKIHNNCGHPSKEEF